MNPSEVVTHDVERQSGRVALDLFDNALVTVGEHAPLDPDFANRPASGGVANREHHHTTAALSAVATGEGLCIFSANDK